jgi:ribose transport system substrate-binding protein
MNVDVRRQKIMEILHSQGFCNVTLLAKELKVSEVTIRTDLSALEEQNKVSRIHGGAVLATENVRSRNFEERTHINQNKKRWIARRAAEQVENHQTIILDASTTAYFIADYLKNHQGLTVFTNGIEVAFKLAENSSTRVILTGGVLRVETASLAGQFGDSILNGVRASKAFLSCTGWSGNLEAMDDDLFEVQLKKEMVNATESLIIVADSSKFLKKGVTSFAPLSRVDMIITDDGIDPLRLNPFRQAGKSVSICGEKVTRMLDRGHNGRQMRIGFANQDDTLPFAALVRQGLVQAAAETKIELLLTDNCQDGPTALANVEYFLDQNVDLVVEYNTDARYSNVIMERLRTLAIPVIAIDIPLPGATFIGVDNYRSGLMGGRMMAQYVMQQWEGHLDKVLSLDLPLSGPIPAARMQGQLDGLRELVPLSDENVIPMDSKNTFEGAYQAVTQLIPALKTARRIAILGINDEATIGAIAAFEKAGSSDRVVAVSQGADKSARQEMLKPNSRLIGAVASFPENYGKIIISIATNILQGKQTPPAVYTSHALVLPTHIISKLNLTQFSYEVIPVENYEAASQLFRSLSETATSPL